MGWAVLAITDGITRVNLISRENNGFYLIDWLPAQPAAKGGGVFQDSPFADGKRPVWMKHENYAESMELGLVAPDQDVAACHLEILRDLLDKAVAYWTADWAEAPVWIEAQGDCETNLRYAIITHGSIPEDANPYGPLFVGIDGVGNVVAEGLALNFEHLYWESERPGTYRKLFIRPPVRQPLVWWWRVRSTSTESMYIPDYAGIQDLPLADFFVEFWLKDTDQIIFGDFLNKKGLFFSDWKIYGSGGVALEASTRATIGFWSTSWNILVTNAALWKENDWNHLVFEWDSATPQWNLYINGTLAAPGGGAIGVGPYPGDIGDNLYLIINNNEVVNQPRTWTRIQTTAWLGNTVQHDTMPLPDANTALILNGWQIWYGTSGSLVKTVVGGYVTPIAGVHKYLDAKDAGVQIPTSALNAIVTLNGGRYLYGVDYCFWGDSTAGPSYGSNIVNRPGELIATVASDRVYFGCNQHIGGHAPMCIVFKSSGQPPFGSLTPDFNPAQWYYWNGAWTNVGAANFNYWASLDDETDGSRWYVILITPPNDAIPLYLNGYPGYWIEWRLAMLLDYDCLFIGSVTDAGINFNTTPQTNLEDIDWINGSIPALAASIRAPIWDDRDSGNTVDLTWARSHLAIRSLERGEDFSPFVNLVTRYLAANDPYTIMADFNINGVYLYGTPTWWPVPSASIDAPCQFESQIPILAATTVAGYYIAFSDAYTVNLTYNNFFTYEGEGRLSIAEQFSGRFRVFIRARSSVASDLTLTLLQSSPIPRTIGSVVLPTTMQVSELGTVDLPGLTGAVQKNTGFTLEIRIANGNAAPQTAYLWDLILWPVDEWAAYSKTIASAETATWYNSVLQYGHLLDPVGDRKFLRSASLAAPNYYTGFFPAWKDARESDSGPYDAYPRGAIQFQGVEVPILLNNRPFRFYSFNQRPYDPASGVFLAEGHHGTRTAFSIIRRYHSMRGIE